MALCEQNNPNNYTMEIYLHGRMGSLSVSKKLKGHEYKAGPHQL